MTADAIRLPYQDPTLDVYQRAEDLLVRMTLEDKTGLMFQPLAALGDFDAPGLFGAPSTRALFDKRINHFNILQAPTARAWGSWRGPYSLA